MPLMGPTRRSGRGLTPRSRSARAELAILDPVATDGHVAPRSATRMGAVVEGPSAVGVPACLQALPGPVTLRVPDDEKEPCQGRQPGTVLGAQLDVPV